MEKKDRSPVRIPEDVYEALEFIRTEGVANMFDANTVQRFAHEYDYHEAVVWLDSDENRVTYREGMFRGFESDEEMETNPAA